MMLLLIFLLIIIAVLRLNVQCLRFKVRVPLKYLSNFWRTFEIPLINFEINLILTWSNICFIIDNHIWGQEPTFTTTDTKLYVPVVTLSTKDNPKLLEQSKSRFKRPIKWNKYEPKKNSRATKLIFTFLN